MTIRVKQLIAAADDQERAQSFWAKHMGIEIPRNETRRTSGQV